ncbi:MAG: ABC-type tungstate transport system, permease component [Bacillales bacterium]|jgi:tungstate transport system substrate-binding protein|nr:ABC-type tungstate transport system, permease component [Bacillales bacterium]
MKKWFFVAVILLLVIVAGCSSDNKKQSVEKKNEKTKVKSEPTKLILATTTSTKDSGFLDVFIPKFEAKYNIKVIINSVGTGAALQLAKDGNADVVLTHAPAQEKPLVDAGQIIDYKKVMYNDFKIVGPKSNPAKVDKNGTAADAMQKIYDTKSKFISRNDGSGTESKEVELWKLVTNKDSSSDPKLKLSPTTDATTKRQLAPLYTNHIFQNAGMSMALTFANQNSGYTLTDRGTWLNLKGNDVISNLKIVSEGDAALKNFYHVSRVNPDKFPEGQIKTAEAIQFIQFLLTEEGEEIVRNYKIKGQNAFEWWGEKY